MTNIERERIEEIGLEIFNDPFLAGKIDQGYISGCVTRVAPLTFWNNDFDILIRTDPRLNARHFNKFIAEQLKKYPELKDGYFAKMDLSCPDTLTFRFN